MRLNDLMTSLVVDAAGQEVGRVRDVRLIQDGPPLASGQAALRVDSLIVGHGIAGRLLGFDHNPVQRPWLLHVLVGRLAREQRVIDWAQVASFSDGVVTLEPGHHE
jgi:hypothetical protein